MSTSPAQNLYCTKKKQHIIPKEWNSYPAAALDCIVYSSLKEHATYHKTAKGATVTVGEVSAKTKIYKDCIWFRKESDRSKAPYATDYCLTWIDNYACKHK